jgi:hypothetical protein
LDQGKVIRQFWTISDDNTALFCPKHPEGFIKQLRAAKQFAFEYEPNDKDPCDEDL